ncbi:MAG: ATP-binding cassette domain-containing protein [Thermoanaerobaculaceae bacterium]
MAKYSLVLAAIGVLVCLLYVAATTTGNYIRLKQERQEMNLRGAITGMVLQFITGVPKVRVAGAENHAFLTWAKSYAAQRSFLFRIGQIKNAVQVLTAGFPVLSSLVIFYVLMKIQEASLLKGQPPSITTGDFIAFNAAFSAFVSALQSLGDASLDMLRIVPIYERLKPIITETPELDEARAYPGKLRGEIQVSHVSFRYAEDGPWILNDLSVHIKPGEFIAFVGASGCGKSTLMRILLGFETPIRGAVYYDGQDLATLDLREVRQQIGVVLQNSTLLPTDIYRNIVGSTGLPVQAAWEAAALAELAEDIQQLPMGMHTRRGWRLLRRPAAKGPYRQGLSAQAPNHDPRRSYLRLG